jgi:hypothetical protein
VDGLTGSAVRATPDYLVGWAYRSPRSLLLDGRPDYYLMPLGCVTAETSITGSEGVCYLFGEGVDEDGAPLKLTFDWCGAGTEGYEEEGRNPLGPAVYRAALGSVMTTPMSGDSGPVYEISQGSTSITLYRGAGFDEVKGLPFGELRGVMLFQRARKLTNIVDLVDGTLIHSYGFSSRPPDRDPVVWR